MKKFGPDISLHILHTFKLINTGYCIQDEAKVYRCNFFAVSGKFQNEILLTLTYLGILCAHNSIITIRLAYSVLKLSVLQWCNLAISACWDTGRLCFVDGGDFLMGRRTFRRAKSAGATDRFYFVTPAANVLIRCYVAANGWTIAVATCRSSPIWSMKGQGLEQALVFNLVFYFSDSVTLWFGLGLGLCSNGLGLRLGLVKKQLDLD